MRVLLITSTFPRSKSDQTPDFVWQLARHLARQGCSVTVLAPACQGAPILDEWEDVEIIRFRYAFKSMERLAYGSGMLANIRKNPFLLFVLPAFLLSMAISIWRLCRRGGVDIINAHWFFPQGWVVAALRQVKLINVPIICSVHGSDAHVSTSLPFRYISRWLEKNIDCHLHAGYGTKTIFESHKLGVGKSFVRPMGLHECFLVNNSSNQRSPFYDFVFVGRLVDQKGVDLLARAFNELVRNLDLNLKLAIAGEGGYKEELEAYVAEKNLGGNVTFLGWLPDRQLDQLYRTSRIAVFPSKTEEGYGLAIAEALVCGCTVLATDFPSVKENFPLESCRVFPSGSWTNLATAMSSCLTNVVFSSDVDECIFLRRHLAWPTVAKEYASYFKKALKDGTEG